METTNEPQIEAINNKVLKVHNSVIQAYSKLNTDALKILFYTLSSITERNMTGMIDFIYFDIREYLQATRANASIGGNDYLAVKKALSQLRRAEITPIGTEKDYDDGPNYTFVIAQATMYNPTKGIFGIRLSYDFHKYLFEFKKRFTSMLLDNYIKINHPNTMKLYGLLYSRYNMTFNANNNINNNSVELSVPIPVKDIRDMLYGLDSDTYLNNFKALKRDTIVPSINRINEQTDDMRVSIEDFVKKGRKVDSIIFKVCLNTQETQKNFKIKRFYTDMYSIAKSPDKVMTREQTQQFKDLFGELAYWRLAKTYSVSHNLSDILLQAEKNVMTLRKVNNDVVREEINKIKKNKKMNADNIKAYAEDYKAREYVEIKGFWKSPTSEEIYKELLKLSQNKVEMKSTMIKNSIERMTEKRIMNSDEAKDIEIASDIAKDEAEFKKLEEQYADSPFSGLFTKKNEQTL